MSFPRAVEALPHSESSAVESPAVDEIVCRVARQAPELMSDLLAVLAAHPELLRPYRERRPSANRLARLQNACGDSEIVRTYLADRARRRYRIAAARAGLLPGGMADGFED